MPKRHLYERSGVMHMTTDTLACTLCGWWVPPSALLAVTPKDDDYTRVTCPLCREVLVQFAASDLEEFA